MAAKGTKASKSKQRSEDRFTASPVEMHNIRRPKATKRGK